MEFSHAKVGLVSGGIVLFIFLFNFLLLSPPSNFAAESIISVEKGASLRNVSLKLKKENFIRSRIFFEAFVILFGGERHVISSDYYFEKKLPVYELARRISSGRSALSPVRVTFPEGFTNEEIANLGAWKLSGFDKEKFLETTEDRQGYLFPDTYFFIFRANEEEVRKAMESNYQAKISSLRPEILKTGRTEKSIIIMASLIEKEAKGKVGERELISGILWKRLALGRALEVDAAPETYKTKGLPQNPIANPGLAAIRAAIYPENSPFLYYLHDADGNVHYAKTFEEHKANKLKYSK